MRRRNAFMAGVSGLMLTVLVACGSRLNQDNFEKVQDGMTQKEVKGILGSPSQSETSTVPLLGNELVKYTYRDAKGEAVVVFKDDKVVTKTGSFNQ